MNGIAIGSELPVGFFLGHFNFEGLDRVGGYYRVIVAMNSEDFCRNGLGCIKAVRQQRTVEGHHRLEIGVAAPGQVQRA